MPQRAIRPTLAVLMLVSALSHSQDETQPPEIRGHVESRHYKQGVELITPLPKGEWHLPAGDYANTRYSPLGQINTSNASRLKPITTMSTGVPQGHEGSPLVVGHTMYVVTPFPNNLIAIDLTEPSGALKWIYEPHPNPQSVGVACCDVVNRGASYADGKIMYNTLDAHTVAVDAETGEEIWRTKVGEINRGETTTMAPLVVKDKLIVGNSGGELGVRGKILALNIETGEEVWTAYNTGPDEEVLIGENFKPWYRKDQGKDLGATTWPGDEWQLGGSTVWGWVSYDPELDLIYYGTGNPGVWNPDKRKGDNKWSSSIIARDPDTGMARWAYQISPHDAWDYDEIMENILVDMEFNGEKRKLLIHPGRTGFVFVLDRETGELLSAEKFVPSTNWADGFDLETGLPRENPEKRPHFGEVTRDICPSSTGGKEFNPASFSPRTGLVYIPAHNTCMDFEPIEVSYIAGTPYLGAEVRMKIGPGGYQGELVAWDPVAGKKVWGIKDEKFPMYSGTLVTAGDLVFFGTMDGWFKVADARNGTELYKFKLASGVISNPMTYLGPDGRQYVALYAGVGGWMGAAAFPSTSTDDPYAMLGAMGAMTELPRNTAPGGVLYVFGL
ncbi:methanol/ethanol family PQQ-dependent dehydrogenase [Gilvimarinus sp. F26214L]|uniref:methanol/ethanol family PQQ-dependent dehydrogenase n=1 Tax=Gilvimarinus sp. DZF01 TaxID=3461371 RepID=UPI004045D7E1